VVPIAIGPTVAPGIVSALSPVTSGTPAAAVANPLAIGGSGGQLIAMLGTLSAALGIVALLLVMAPLIVRHRRAQGIERAQLKWFAVVGIVVAPAFVVGILAGGFTSGPLAIVANAAWLIGLLGLALLPVALVSRSCATGFMRSTE
jgi:hypothetical protein